MSLFICDCDLRWNALGKRRLPRLIQRRRCLLARSASESAAASKTARTAADSAPNSAGAGSGLLSVGDASDTASRSPPGSPVENSPYPGAKIFPSRVPSMCSSSTSIAPLMFPLGPATFMSTLSTRTSSNTTSGTFSGRYTLPTRGGPA